MITDYGKPVHLAQVGLNDGQIGMWKVEHCPARDSRSSRQNSHVAFSRIESLAYLLLCAQHHGGVGKHCWRVNLFVSFP